MSNERGRVSPPGEPLTVSRDSESDAPCPSLEQVRQQMEIANALVREASEIMNIVYAGNFPAGIESFLVRAHRAVFPSAGEAHGASAIPTQPDAETKEDQLRAILAENQRLKDALEQMQRDAAHVGEQAQEIARLRKELDTHVDSSNDSKARATGGKG